ncbi:MAG: adenosylcobinamide-GDP ribazoletransferase [Elusimicrobia bacterium]|nr:adenosylcobinamide-GDP ribazoletransferase [Elusimicrobiota bacterium]
MRLFLIALQFLTILPLTKNYVKEEKDLAGSMIFYPLVGLCIGLLTLWIYSLSEKFFIPSISLIFAFIAGIIFTGALHLDGFADSCDGFYAGKNKEEILKIMKDSRIGTMAVVGLFCLLLLKCSLYFSLLFKDQLKNAFLIVPVISRWLMTLSASLYPYAREEGTAGAFLKHIGKKELFFSSLLLIVIIYPVLGFNGIIIAGLSFSTVWFFLQWVKNKIDGITGDILGAVNELAEITALFVFQFIASNEINQSFTLI